MRFAPATDEVVLSLQGGLGNQLFQWALGHSLTAQGRHVLFDRARCRGNRPYALNGLVPRDRLLARGIGAVLVAADKANLLSDRPGARLRRIKQKRAGFDPTVIERLDGAAYVTGYFQSPQYFQSVNDEVRNTVLCHVRSMLTPAGVALIDDLADDPSSVAVHVRRGDYVSEANAAFKHGVLNERYYREALKVVGELGHSRRVWFSDDPNWVRAHLANDGDAVVSSQVTKADGGEIALMAACRSRVVANSSFSWWGGWLGDPSTPEHPVIAPRTWFADGHSDASDLIPSTWARL